MARLKTVYNDGELALHLDLHQLLEYDSQTVTVRKGHISTALSKRGNRPRAGFLKAFPVGSTHTPQDLGIPPYENHYTNGWAKLDLEKFVKYLTENWQSGESRCDRTWMQ